MIEGRVRDNAIIIPLEVAAPSQSSRQIEAVVDTGYNGYVTLPSSLTTALGLSLVGNRNGTLADGSVVILDVYLAEVLWHGRRTEVLLSQTSGTVLVGMSLLRGSRMIVEAIEGGRVTIEEISPN